MNDERRRFSDGEHASLWIAAEGICEGCGAELAPGWHADHHVPHSRGGPTDVTNGRALCPTCNRKKGSTMPGTWPGPDLREWQQEALEIYLAKRAPDFLAVATPGAGKTMFALRLAHELMEAGTVERVVIVVPSDQLKEQWAAKAHEAGMSIDSTTRNASGIENRADFCGSAVTYAQVARNPDVHKIGVARRRTLVILDEIHHAGDERSWGDGLKVAYAGAVRRLALSGTPFRSDDNPIPFVTYAAGPDGIKRSVADFDYGYGRAIRDRVCRQVDFHFYDGQMQWRDSGVAGPDKIASLSAQLGREDLSTALTTALAPATGWVEKLLAVADGALTDLRREVPDAGGLVIAYRGSTANAYADSLKRITGTRPVVVLAEEMAPEDARRAIETFSKSTERWLVAVKLVSEGVDVPRLAVGVYATRTKTPMFFRQAVGRFVRRATPDEEHSALVFCPAVDGLRVMAAQIEEEIRHEIEEERQREAREREPGTDGQGTLDLFERTPIAASDPVFDRAIHSGEEFTPEENATAEELCREYGIGISNLPAMRKLVRDRLGAKPAAPAAAERTAGSERADQRKKRLKGDLARRVRRYVLSRGRDDFKQVGWRVNQHIGVSSIDSASIRQLEAGIDFMIQMERES